MTEKETKKKDGKKKPFLVVLLTGRSLIRGTQRRRHGSDTGGQGNRRLS